MNHITVISYLIMAFNSQYIHHNIISLSCMTLIDINLDLYFIRYYHNYCSRCSYIYDT